MSRRHPSYRQLGSRLARYYSGTAQRRITETVYHVKELLRKTAQPVAVLTARNSAGDVEEHPYHGATLSSFTSIAMVPYPLISFALRIPSRMATLLTQHEPLRHSHTQPTSDPSASTSTTSSSQGTMVINLLSASQAAVAHKFSRPDLYPHPFTSVPYTLSPDSIPVLDGCLGAITCQLAAPAIPLHDLHYLSSLGLADGRRTDAEAKQAELSSSSVLFIARVTRIEEVLRKEIDEEPLDKQPLIYYHRGYTSCVDNLLLLRPQKSQ